MFAGQGVGQSAVRGQVFVVPERNLLPPPARHDGFEQGQIDALESALSNVLQDLKSQGSKAQGTSAEIFEALCLVLEDQELAAAGAQQIRQGWDAATSIQRAVESLAGTLSESEFFAERLSDIRQLAKQVAAKIHGIELGLKLPQTGKYVIVARELYPSDTAEFTSGVVGVVIIQGGPTSHTAIICRALGLPTVVSCPGAVELRDGDQVLVDPVGNRVVLDGGLSLATRSMQFLPTGKDPLLSVLANIGSLAEATAAASSAASGVGLFRTEMLYLTRASRPSVSQQAADYAEVFKASPGGPLIARTLDSAKDKQLPFLSQPDGTSQVPREFLLEQLSALERARVHSGKEVWVMAPMIANLKEATDFVKLARTAGEFKVGIMVEVPSVIADLTRLCGLVDFVSVGTNDLAKFLFQVERDESASSDLLNHWQPALISALAEIAGSSAAAGIQSGVCGESAADPLFSIVLAGLGFNSVSVAPALLGQVSAALSSITKDQAVLVADAAKRGQSPAQSKSLALEMLTNLED